MDGDFRPAPQPGFNRACDLKRNGHTTPDIVLPDELDSFQEYRRRLDQPSGLPHRQARRRVDPKLSLEQAYPFLAGSQLEHVDLILILAGMPLVFELVIQIGRANV